jgi:hypothetical protein
MFSQLQIISFSCLSIACFNIWLEVYLGILKSKKIENYIFLIKMAPLKMIASTLEIHN